MSKEVRKPNIKVNYSFKLTSPLHTGSDEDMGTLKALRRLEMKITKPVVYSTKLDRDNKRKLVMQFCWLLWKNIDKKSMGQSRLKGIWDEFTRKLKRATACTDKYKYLDKICKYWDITAFSNPEILTIIDSISDEEFLETLREESQSLVLMLRTYKDMKFGELPVINFSPEVTKKKEFEQVPAIAGNSIRGRLRRLAVDFYFEKVGITEEGSLTNVKLYHIMYTGGIIEESTQYEDFEARKMFLDFAPFMRVFGSAIGKGTIQGAMSVGWALPQCTELGTGHRSHHELKDVVFQTRHDSSKTETRFDFKKEEKKITSQMKYEYEIIIPGAVFDHEFLCKPYDELTECAFWHTMKLFKEHMTIGGMGSVGNGNIDASSLEVDEDKAQKYIDYLEEHKEKIKEFLINA